MFVVNCFLLAGLIAGASYLQNRQHADEGVRSSSLQQETTSASSTVAPPQTTVQTSAPQTSTSPAPAKTVAPRIYNDRERGDDD